MALVFSRNARAQPAPDAPPAEADPNGARIWLDVPVFDVQFGALDHPVIPSMGQSTAVAGDLYTLSHFGIGQLIDPYDAKGWKRFLGRAALVAFDGLTISVPFFGGWQHEEWHRAVMGNRGIGSEDEIYGFQLFSSHVSVSHVEDAGLANLTEQHPAEAVRLYAAGIEANYELATHLEKNEFFMRSRIASGTTALVMYAANSLYWAACMQLSTQDVAQPASIPDRDFVGPDCTGWAHDLFHPGQSYASRGLDPNGGVQRYQSTDSVGPAGAGYLKTQFALSLLNFIDPNIIGINAFTIAGQTPTRLNAHVRHEPTSFGTDTSLEMFFEHGDLRLFGAAHTYLDRDYGYRPGLSVELVRWPLARTIALHPALTVRADAWVQPAGLDTASNYVGGRLQARLGVHAIGPLETWIEAEGKTAGWAAGSVALDPAVAVRAGVSLALLR